MAAPALPDLTGRYILVTGSTNGIGLEAAVAFAARGARVGVVGRDPARTERVAAEVRTRAGSQAVDSFHADFALQASVRALAADVLARWPRLDVLVNNAGTVSAERTVTPDGIETTFAVNHLGYVLLTELLLDRLRASAPARIVNVSSRGHYRGTMDLEDLGYARGGYAIMRAYCRSKLGNVLYTRHLARRLEGTGVTVNSLHPGGVATNIWTGAPAWAAPILALAKLFMLTPEQGSHPIQYLAASPEVEGKTGLYYHRDHFREPSRLARDEGLGERLQAESARLVGLD